MTRPTLLGYLAQFGSFTRTAELLCTQGLAYLLKEHKDARSSLADWVQARTDVRINESMTWLPEARLGDRGRPDLLAHDDGDVPFVIVEAKLTARLTEVQLQMYAQYLLESNSGQSALLVLVPKGRTGAVEDIIHRAFGPSEESSEHKLWHVNGEGRSGRVIICVISWDALFDILYGGKSERLRHEIEQLQGMYDVLIDDFIEPLADEEALRQWRKREDDLVKVMDRVTRQLTAQTDHNVYPMQFEPLEGVSPDAESSGHRFRYVCPIGDSCYSIGVRDSFADWVTPIWMRFHKDTGNFGHIRQRIESSGLRCLRSSGHIWMPLDVPTGVWGEQMIEALVDQAEKIAQIALPDE